MSKRRKQPREKDLTRRLLSGEMDEDPIEQQQRFSARSKHAEQRKILRTSQMRAEEAAEAGDVETLPVGEVVQVYSLYSEVEHEGQRYLCVVRKTLSRISETGIVVGDRVRFRATGATTDDGRPEAVIEAALPRRTVLTRTDSFASRHQDPIVANADQVLIVASLREPRVKWGLVDRMLVAARSGGVEGVVCLNKVDLASDEATKRRSDEGEDDRRHEGTKARRHEVRDEGEEGDEGRGEAASPLAPRPSPLEHYESMGIRTARTSIVTGEGLEELREILRGRTTVLAGHSGVGKSSLIRAVEPSLDLRVGRVSEVTEKGRHTTTSARRYALEGGGWVIDTPGIKLFGLWDMTAERLEEFFPDVAAGTAPPWRVASFERIAATVEE